MKRGYIVLADGTRLGICGDVIIENGNVTTTTNFSSINLRIAHQIKNCSLDIYHHIVGQNDIKNTLLSFILHFFHLRYFFLSMLYRLS